MLLVKGICSTEVSHREIEEYLLAMIYHVGNYSGKKFRSDLTSIWMFVTKNRCLYLHVQQFGNSDFAVNPDQCLLVRGACKLISGACKQRLCTLPEGKWDFFPCSSSVLTECHTCECYHLQEQFKNMSDVQNTESLEILLCLTM